MVSVKQILVIAALVVLNVPDDSVAVDPVPEDVDSNFGVDPDLEEGVGSNFTTCEEKIIADGYHKDKALSNRLIAVVTSIGSQRYLNMSDEGKKYTAFLQSVQLIEEVMNPDAYCSLILKSTG